MTEKNITIAVEKLQAFIVDVLDGEASSNGSGQQTMEQVVNILEPVETWLPLVGSAEAEEINP